MEVEAVWSSGRHSEHGRLHSEVGGNGLAHHSNGVPQVHGEHFPVT